jgi:hypothetical protein
MLLIDNLGDIEDGEPPEEETPAPAEASPALEEDDAAAPVPVGDGLVVLAGARGDLDDAAAAMLGQVLERRGANVRLVPFLSLRSARLKDIDLGGAAVVVLSYLNSDSLAHARLLVRRVRRRAPDARVVVGFWTFAPEDIARRDPVAATGADHVATSLGEAVEGVLAMLTPEEEAAEGEAEPSRIALAAVTSHA